MKATALHPLLSWFTLPTKVLARTLPVKVTLWPARGPVDSTYMLASMILLPTAPGPPLGVYQKLLVSLTVFGESVSREPEKEAHKSAVPHALGNTNPPPCCGVSKTFINPCQGA